MNHTPKPSDMTTAMYSLPTLLCSRACTEPLHLEVRKARRPAALEIPDDTPEAAIHVKNTFIDIALLSPSLEDFYRERVVRTCPSTHVGRLVQDILSGDIAATTSPCAAPSPCGIQTPYMQTPLGENMLHFPWQSLGTTPSGREGRQSEVFHDIRLADLLGPSMGTAYVDVNSYRRATLSPRVERPPWFPPSQSIWNMAPLPPSPAVPPPPPGPALGSPEMPSVGSSGHFKGSCRPCAFLHTKGCDNGLACTFCHLCEPGERKRRQKEKLQHRRAAQQARLGLKMERAAV